MRKNILWSGEIKIELLNAKCHVWRKHGTIPMVKHGNCTTYDRRALQSSDYLPSRTPIAPDVTGMPKRSTRTKPAKSLPDHPATIQKERSVQVHQSWDRETEKQLLSQDQTVKYKN
jgi:hypothetical protein